MKKQYILTIICLLICTNTFAQSNRNSVYVEIGGNGGAYSINYDRLFILSQQLRFAPRIGISWLGSDRFTAPIEANLLLGKNSDSKNFAEFGLGTTIVSKKSKNINGFTLSDEIIDEKGMNALLSSRLGFRHQKPQGGFMYRIGFTLLYNSYPIDHKFIPFGGVSLGYTF
ncbi:hypothetical protein [Pedobacter sp. Hv1]|uniref:hypothetical protein n=1 Tax=Pedobacter sp. Hv1 TaxID=1740090 RepID=UPI0006D8B825|nr:hypothetical protein [Pedobacter sp. Hv1]KQC02453.1 hypothetical protein AQF98_02420 [Pedobacter sp. Hv1]